MKKINIDWLKKIQSKIDKLDRNSSNTKDSRCQKEVFIHRYFRFLKNKYFKIQIKNEIHYAFFNSNKVTVNNGEHIYFTNGIDFFLGYSKHEYNISFLDERLKWKNFSKIHWNDIIKIKYEEITNKKYLDIVTNFIK